MGPRATPQYLGSPGCPARQVASDRHPGAGTIDNVPPATEQALRDAIDQVPGLTWSTRRLHPFNPGTPLRAAVHREVTLRGKQHWDISTWAATTPAWPAGGAHGGALVWWDPAETRPLTTQGQVCGDLLAAKATGTDSRVSCYWSPSFLLHDGTAYLLDGHHALVLAHLAVQQGLLEGPLPAYVHLLSPWGAAGSPRLDCDCKLLKAVKPQPLAPHSSGLQAPLARAPQRNMTPAAIVLQSS